MAYIFMMILPVTFDVSTNRQYSGTQIILGNVASPGRLDRPHLVPTAAKRHHLTHAISEYILSVRARYPS